MIRAVSGQDCFVRAYFSRPHQLCPLAGWSRPACAHPGTLLILPPFPAVQFLSCSSTPLSAGCPVCINCSESEKSLGWATLDACLAPPFLRIGSLACVHSHALLVLRSLLAGQPNWHTAAPHLLLMGQPHMWVPQSFAGSALSLDRAALQAGMAAFC